MLKDENIRHDRKVSWRSLTIIGIFLSCTISTLILLCNADNIANGYALITYFPIIFGALYFFLLNKSFLESKYPITVLFYKLLQYIRFVIMPPFLALAGENCGVSYLNPTTSSLKISTILMVYEFIITAFAIHFIPRKQSAGFSLNVNFASGNEYGENSGAFWYSGDRLIYAAFIALSAFAFVFFGNIKLINLFVLATDTDSRVASESLGGSLENLLNQCVSLSFAILFVIFVAKFQKLYLKSEHKRYYYLALAVGLINTGLIVGESRTEVLYSAFCTFALLIIAFPKERKNTFLIIGSAFLVIVVSMTIYKSLYAFRYASYSEAVKGSNFSIKNIAEMMQSYFMGPEQNAIDIDFSEANNPSFLQMIYDFLRSTAPINFLVKNFGETTSEMFNSAIYHGSQTSGYIISSSGYGYMYLTFGLAPLITLLNIYLTSLMERLAYYAKTAEHTYIYYYCTLRSAFFMFQNTPNTLIKLTIMLLTGGLLFFVSTKTSIGVKKRYEAV